MKQLIRRIFTLILSMCLLLLSGMTAFASGEGNIDGGGGGMGSGTATDVWHGQDGVRVTVVTADGSVASTPFDLSNANVANNVLNFGKVCKLQYSSGSSLSPNGSYSYSKPGIALPRIISGSSSRASIEAIRRYFCSEYAAQLVSAKSGIPFEELVSGSYKLVIEPIAYFTHGGRNYAMTATEAALYNQKSGGTLRSRMPKIRCPYCGRSAVLRKASYVYKEKALDEYLYVCAGYPECDAYVGVHAGTMRPKGTLANGDLRHKRIETHRLFDSIWKYGILSRKEAYRWMQDIFCLPSSQAHIGQFSDYRCDRLKDECRRVLQNNHVKIAC